MLNEKSQYTIYGTGEEPLEVNATIGLSLAFALGTVIAFARQELGPNALFASHEHHTHQTEQEAIN